MVCSPWLVRVRLHRRSVEWCRSRESARSARTLTVAAGAPPAPGRGGGALRRKENCPNGCTIGAGHSPADARGSPYERGANAGLVPPAPEDPCPRTQGRGRLERMPKRYAAGSLAPGPGTQTYTAGHLTARVAEGAALPAVPQAGMSWVREEDSPWIVIVVIVGVLLLWVLLGTDWGGSGPGPAAVSPSPGYQSSQVPGPNGSVAESHGHRASHRRLVHDQQHRPRTSDEP
jgi:hypothetical protein